MKKIWQTVKNGIYTLLAMVLLSGFILVPVTVYAWCIQFWVNLF